MKISLKHLKLMKISGRGGGSGAAATPVATGLPGPNLSPSPLGAGRNTVWIEIFTSVTSNRVDPCLIDKNNRIDRKVGTYIPVNLACFHKYSGYL